MEPSGLVGVGLFLVCLLQAFRTAKNLCRLTMKSSSAKALSIATFAVMQEPGSNKEMGEYLNIDIPKCHISLLPLAYCLLCPFGTNFLAHRAITALTSSFFRSTHLPLLHPCQGSRRKAFLVVGCFWCAYFRPSAPQKTYADLR